MPDIDIGQVRDSEATHRWLSSRLDLWGPGAVTDNLLETLTTFCERTGMTPDEMVEKLKSLQGSQVISINHLFSARARQRTLEEWLEANLPVKSFEDLHCPLTVVTVDVVEGEEVTIDEGPLVPALLASSAVPGMFPPVRRGEQLLADGGVIDSLSTHLAYRLGAEKVIAVDVYPPLEHENLWVDPLLAMTGLDLPFYLLGTVVEQTPGFIASLWRSSP